MVTRKSPTPLKLLTQRSTQHSVHPRSRARLLATKVVKHLNPPSESRMNYIWTGHDDAFERRTRKARTRGRHFGLEVRSEGAAYRSRRGRRGGSSWRFAREKKEGECLATGAAARPSCCVGGFGREARVRATFQNTRPVVRERELELPPLSCGVAW